MKFGGEWRIAYTLFFMIASCTESGWIDTARTELQRKIEL